MADPRAIALQIELFLIFKELQTTSASGTLLPQIE